MNLFLFLINVFAQEEKNLQMDFVVSDEQLIVFFVILIISIVGIILYISREMILRKKTTYEKKDFESKKNKDFEKYHSDWQEDYEEFGKRSKSKEDLKKYFENEEIPDLYKTLGLTTEATDEQIKKQFRKLVKETHPDKTKDPQSSEKMAKINQAYEILSNTELRKEYDKIMNVD